MNKFSFIAALMLAFLSAPSAFAQTAPPAPTNIADSPCDLEYFKTLESRAWIEAQREITQNQNLIYKPDSVLAYTCFDQFANVLANMQEWQGFSETNRWGSVISPLTTAMDEALNGLIAPSLISYLNSNFSNSYLGGRGEASYKPGDTISGGSYTCGEMNKVWQAAKCYNFQTLPQDGFFTFEEHREEDKRRYPPGTECTNPTIWDEQITLAGLKPNQPPAQWPFDKVQVYYDQLDPAQCGTSTPIPTGVMVNTKNLSINNGQAYPEMICIIPGCYSDPNANGECKPSGS